MKWFEWLMGFSTQEGYSQLLSTYQFVNKLLLSYHWVITKLLLSYHWVITKLLPNYAFHL